MRGAFAGALELTLSRPGWWAVAGAGFLARGGLLLFVAVFVELPSPITVTLMFGSDSVTGAGQPTDRLVTTVAILTVAALGAVLAAAVVAAWTDVVSFARVAEDEPGMAARRRVSRAREAREVLGVSWLQSLGVLPAVAGFVLAAPAVRDAVIGEFLLPSAPEISYVVRVFEGAQGPLLRAVAVLAGCELVVTIATRIHLATPGGGSTMASYGGALARVVRRPNAIAVTWAVGWAILLGAVAVALWAVALAWERVRTVFLDPAIALPFVPGACPGSSTCPEVGALLPAVGTAVVATALFVTVWIAALALIGVASAFRSTLWTLALADRPTEPPGVRWRADAHA